MYSFKRKVDQWKHDGSKLKDEVTDNVDGMVVEPLNPSLLISEKYILDDKDRKRVINSSNTKVKWKKEDIENIKSQLDVKPIKKKPYNPYSPGKLTPQQQKD